MPRQRTRWATRWLFALTGAVLVVASLAAALPVGAAAPHPVWKATATAVTSSPASSLAVHKPSGVVIGDFMLVQIAFLGGESISIEAPSGWTLVRRDDQGTAIGSALYYRFAQPSEPALPTWGFSQNVSANAGLTVYSNVHRTQAVIASGATLGSGGAVSAPSLSASSVDKLVTLYSVQARPEIGSDVAPADMTQLYRLAPAGAERSSAAFEVDVDAGDTGAKTWTISPSGQWIGQSVLLHYWPGSTYLYMYVPIVRRGWSVAP